jgi:hypothetical protein
METFLSLFIMWQNTFIQWGRAYYMVPVATRFLLALHLQSQALQPHPRLEPIYGFLQRFSYNCKVNDLQGICKSSMLRKELALTDDLSTIRRLSCDFSICSLC